MQSEPGLWQDSWRSDVLERSLQSADRLAFVWEEDEHLQGFVCAHDVGFRGYLSELVVGKNQRRKGIGQQLVRRVEQELQKRGCTILIADVWKGAEKFYRSLGWTPPDVVLLRQKLTKIIN
jgi:GNAT superfamily N-acetyltransferase